MLSELDDSIQYCLVLLKNDKQGLTTPNDLQDLDNSSLPWETVYEAMKEEGLIKDSCKIVLLTDDGKKAASMGWLEFKKQRDLQQLNEHSIASELRTLELKNARLISENLKLQNRQLKRDAWYTVIGFILGAIISKVELILTFWT